MFQLFKESCNQQTIVIPQFERPQLLSTEFIEVLFLSII
jgi:hypothetical protein